jgi:hypothetical protein
MAQKRSSMSSKPCCALLRRYRNHMGRILGALVNGNCQLFDHMILGTGDAIITRCTCCLLSVPVEESSLGETIWHITCAGVPRCATGRAETLTCKCAGMALGSSRGMKGGVCGTTIRTPSSPNRNSADSDDIHYQQPRTIESTNQNRGTAPIRRRSWARSLYRGLWMSPPGWRGTSIRPHLCTRRSSRLRSSRVGPYEERVVTAGGKCGAPEGGEGGV